ncbi:uncharacterized protein LOC143187800 isoform X2 [Calliopsis andreniformis]|uniref:uncharacterized protein LOC143187800 isoform X2 n=1 Tax=Calliopsis andreniformis TaxID=337506 RepID=UPI003FCE1724
MNTTVNNQENVQIVEKLKNADGYPLWKFQIVIHLEAAGLLSVVLAEATNEIRITEQWREKDAKARKIIEEK